MESDKKTKVAPLIQWSNSSMMQTRPVTRVLELDESKIHSVEDCAKILKFLSSIVLDHRLPEGVEYGGFSEVSEYYK